MFGLVFSVMSMMGSFQMEPAADAYELAADVMGQIMADESGWDGCFFRCTVVDDSMKPPYHKVIENWIQGGANGSDEECCKMAATVCGRIGERIRGLMPNSITTVSYCSVYDGSPSQ